jgi:hypothetical protein
MPWSHQYFDGGLVVANKALARLQDGAGLRPLRPIENWRPGAESAYCSVQD